VACQPVVVVLVEVPDRCTTAQPELAAGEWLSGFIFITTDSNDTCWRQHEPPCLESNQIQTGEKNGQGKSDPEQYKLYVAANAEAFKTYGAKFLVRGGVFETPEGSSRSRNVVLEFPSYQAALDCWHSPPSQAAIKLREAVSTIDLVVIEGYDGPQP